MAPFLLSRGLMEKLKVLLSLAMLFVHTACIQIPEFEAPGPEEPRPCDTQELVAIQWVLPVEGARIRGTVRVEPRLTGPVPDVVELLVDGIAVATLTHPFILDWESQSVSEGTHELTVRARRCGQEFLSSPRRLDVDRTKPKLISQTPWNGAQRVSVHQVIQAEFSESLLSDSVNRETVRLLAGGSEIQADVTLSQDGRLLTLRPLVPPPVNVTMSVVLDEKVSDAAGNSVAFPSEGWSWTVPAFLPVGEALTQEPEHPNIESFSLGMGADAQPIIAWTEGWDEPFQVHVKRWTGSTWEYIGAPLSPRTTGNALECVLQVDSAGVPTVMWHEKPQDNAHQWEARRWNGLAWEALGPPLTPHPNSRGLRWQFAQGRNSHPTFVLEEQRTGTHELLVQQWNGSSWSVVGSAISLLNGSTLNFLRMEVDAQGRPLVTWGEMESGGATSITSAMLWMGTWWQNIGSTLSNAPSALAFDAQGIPYVGALESKSGALKSLVKTWSGSAWTNLGGVFEDIGPSVSTQVTAMRFDGSGRPIVALTGQEGAYPSVTRRVRLKRWTGAQWEALGEALVSPPGPTTGGPPQFGLSQDGDVYVAWLEDAAGTSPADARLHVYRLNQ
ncbi:Ig-like domain-containing protein [Corallococcus sp. Z5C101001]|uniref:Ig-like domain-containing protein n=1 Tax=Corallococcus sp. Z5C101001 TaxID=2596829 RepID=UPI00117FC0C3|nr:Ig-like domain-containing protein [Corallococcus sp. Z5C101001]TSC27605.1 hypothetical protein FOF48_19520 [Corallococcus sp. Z5C101001]